MAKYLQLDCESGISGDMTVAALLDAGASEEALREVLATVPADGFRVKISRVSKSGLDACDFNVILDEAHENHDHDMEYLYGHCHELAYSHIHEHDHGDGYAHSHEHHHDHGHHEHRNLNDVLAVIDATCATEGAKAIAHRTFQILAEAEAKAHGVSLDEVHFHEVGAIDSIVDILAAAVCLDDLGFDGVIVRRLADGYGTVRCQHGIIPVPVPAVLNIVSSHGLPLHSANVEGEMVTPTGAAFVAAVRTAAVPPETYTVVRTGFGAGKRTYAGASGLLRAQILEEAE